MPFPRNANLATLICGAALLTACGNTANRDGDSETLRAQNTTAAEEDTGSTIWDLFRAREDQGRVGAVNKYIWNAALDVLDFLPVQSVDPFTGVITTGYGNPPGGGRTYRATIYVSDPALEARSLNVALMTRSGPADAATTRAIEDAILTRARQLRAQDSRL